MDFMDVPFVYVPYEVKLKLLNLDIPSKGYGNNWLYLAGQLGFSCNQVLSLETKKSSDGSNTLKLLEEYSKDSSNTVGKLIEALNQIKRPREIKELVASEKQILQAFQASKISTFEFPLDAEDTTPSQYIYNSQNDGKSNNLDNYYRNFDTITSISGYQLTSPKPSTYYKKTSDYCPQLNTLKNVFNYLDNESNSDLSPQKYSEKYSSVDFKVCLPPEKLISHTSSKKFGNIRLFISYCDGENSFQRDVLKLCQQLDILFHCNVDLKNHRLNKEKVKDYFQKADFVLVCCNSQYKHIVESWSCLIKEIDQALHTKLIYKNMLKLYKAGKNIDHFIPVLLNGCNDSDIPDWLRKTDIFKWPSEKNDIISYITSKKQLLL